MDHGFGLRSEANLGPGEQHPVFNPGDLNHTVLFSSPGPRRRAGLAYEDNPTSDDHCNHSDPVNPGAAHGKPLSTHSSEDSPRRSPVTCPLQAIRCTRYPIKVEKVFLGYGGGACRGYQRVIFPKKSSKTMQRERPSRQVLGGATRLTVSTDISGM